MLDLLGHLVGHVHPDRGTSTQDVDPAMLAVRPKGVADGLSLHARPGTIEGACSLDHVTGRQGVVAGDRVRRRPSKGDKEQEREEKPLHRRALLERRAQAPGRAGRTA